MVHQTTSITTKVFLNPEELDSNIKFCLQKKIVDIYENKCSEDYGYIIKIKNIEKIIDTNISPTNSYIFFTVKVNITCLKPDISESYESVVCVIFNKGIFTEIENKLKVLIPIDRIKNYKLNEDLTVCTTNGVDIKKGSILKVKIYDYKYSNGNFNCLGCISD